MPASSGNRFMNSVIAGRTSLGILMMFLVPTCSWALGSTPVTVVNPTDIAKAQGIQRPWSGAINCAAQSPSYYCRGFLTLPTTYRVVIEYVSASCLIDNTVQILRDVSIQAYTGGFGLTFSLSFPDRYGTQGNSGSSINEVNLGQMVRFYAEAGSTIGGYAYTNTTTSFTGYPNCDITLSGQAIDVP